MKKIKGHFWWPSHPSNPSHPSHPSHQMKFLTTTPNLESKFETWYQILKPIRIFMTILIICIGKGTVFFFFRGKVYALLTNSNPKIFVFFFFRAPKMAGKKKTALFFFFPWKSLNVLTNSSQKAVFFFFRVQEKKKQHFC